MQKTCINCQAIFEVTAEDLAFLNETSPVIGGKKYQIPPPTHCPACRQQRRLAVVNQMHLYKRKCDLTGAGIISNFHPDDPYKIYEQRVWFSDQWSALDYGREFDFSRGFFEQLKELNDAVPKYNLQTGYQFDENSAYTNCAGKNKNCYLIFDSDENWDCLYSYSINHCKNCMDCYRARNCELCFECIDSTYCYDSYFLQDCDNCTESMFLKNCIGCKNCLMCSNLKNKQYYIENKQADKEQFEAIKQALRFRPAVESAKNKFDQLAAQYPQKYMHGVYNENVFGDYLDHCKNAVYCFDSSHLWDCKYIYQGFMPLKNCMDIQECGESEKLYECAFSGYQNYHNCFSISTLSDCGELLYCISCPHCKNCFGSAGLQRKEYCVLNKQYSKEEYEKLVPRIIEHMKINNEWGEFFPLNLSVFPYNLTLAQNYFPLTKEEALAKGCQWRDPDKKEYQPATYVPPDNVNQVEDSVTGEILACRETGKNYRIATRELELLKQINMPLPDKCFETRHEARLKKRNKRRLHNRKCDNCRADILTTYGPDRKEKVFCGQCYLVSLS